MIEGLKSELMTIAGKTITVYSLLLFTAIIAAFLLVSWLLRRLMSRGVYPKIKLDERFSKQISRAIHYVLIFTGLALAFEKLIPNMGIMAKLQTFIKFPLFTIKNVQVSLSSIIILIIILLLFAIISRVLQRFLLDRFFSFLQIEPGVKYTFNRVVHYTIMVIGAIFAFQTVGIDFSGLAVIFGFLSVGIGFGLQNVTSNFIAGLILLFERPIKVGDRVSISDLEGDIDEINIRSTRVQTIDNISIIVPNSEFISSNVINWSYGDPKIRLNIDVGVSYNSDLDTVIRCLKEVADEDSEVLKKPAPEVLLRNFGDSAWDMRLNLWLKSPKRHRQMRSKINCAIVRKFRKNNIEIPFPQRDINFRNDLPLPGLTPPDKKKSTKK